MYDMDSEIIVWNSTKTKDIQDIDKAIEKLKQQEKRLVDLYLSSTINVETINHENDIIKKCIYSKIKKYINNEKILDKYKQVFYNYI